MTQTKRHLKWACGLALALALPGITSLAQRPEPEPKKLVVKTEAEWAKQLTRAQFMVCRMKATEAPFTGKYVHNKQKGTYKCVCCGAELFSSAAKFESGTGWPSFWRPIARDTLVAEQDFSMQEVRTEVMCSQCGAHLGHVFDDGPLPTGLRYCINSVALSFVKDTKTPAKTKAKAKTKTKSKSKAKTKTRTKAEAPDNDTSAGTRETPTTATSSSGSDTTEPTAPDDEVKPSAKEDDQAGSEAKTSGSTKPRTTSPKRGGK